MTSFYRCLKFDGSTSLLSNIMPKYFCLPTDFRMVSCIKIFGYSKNLLDLVLNHITLDLLWFKLILQFRIQLCSNFNCEFNTAAAAEEVDPEQTKEVSSAYCTKSPSVICRGIPPFIILHLEN